MFFLSRYNHRALCLLMGHVEVINGAIKSLQPLCNIYQNRGFGYNWAVKLSNGRAISLVKLPLNDSVEVLN